MMLINPVIQRIRSNMHCKGCPLYENEDYAGCLKARDAALKLNEKHVPSKITILFIAESPPKAFIRNGEAYFYSSGPERFNSIAYHIDQVLFRSKNKNEFFERFKDRGFYLIDMVKCPIGGLPESVKRRAIIRCVEYLKEELRELKFEKAVFIGKKTFNEIRDHLTLDFPHELLPLPFYSKTNVEKFREGVARVVTASCGESPAYKPQR
ncbi:MAG: uracil-DNA glycosylase family protein [Fervidicoccaceae archaeon]